MIDTHEVTLEQMLDLAGRPCVVALAGSAQGLVRALNDLEDALDDLASDAGAVALRRVNATWVVALRRYRAYSRLLEAYGYGGSVA